MCDIHADELHVFLLRFSDRTPLYLAVGRVRMGVVNELLNWGADCNAQNRRGNTPLHKAVEMGSYKVYQSINIFIYYILYFII